MEPSADFRESGAVPNTTDDKGMTPHALHETIPLCFARQPYLRDAIKEIDKNQNLHDEVKRIINKEINCETCKEFTDWQQGFTPKEHREMLDRRWMLDFQAKREEDDKKWRDAQRRDDLAWREKQEENTGKRHSVELWIIGGVVTVALIVGAIIAAIVERGYFWPLWTLTK